MKEHTPKNVSPIAENLSQAGMNIDELFPTTKQEKDRAMFEHETFHPNKKPNADELSKHFKTNITPTTDSSFQAGLKTINDLFPIGKEEKDTAMIELEAFHPNKRPNADELSKHFKTNITPTTDSSFQAGLKTINDLFPISKEEKDTAMNEHATLHTIKRPNSNKR